VKATAGSDHDTAPSSSQTWNRDMRLTCLMKWRRSTRELFRVDRTYRSRSSSTLKATTTTIIIITIIIIIIVIITSSSRHYHIFINFRVNPNAERCKSCRHWCRQLSSTGARAPRLSAIFFSSLRSRTKSITANYPSDSLLHIFEDV